MKAAADFIVTEHDHLAGARLSLHGQWGNRPFDTVDDAIAEARRIGGPHVIIKHEQVRLRKARK